jgi:hypothetical protein
MVLFGEHTAHNSALNSDQMQLQNHNLNHLDRMLISQKKKITKQNHGKKLLARMVTRDYFTS